MERPKIEKGIPVPKPRRSYPFREMDVGDSFLIPGATHREVGGILTWANKIVGKRFVSRTVEGGIRIWRTE